MRASLLTKKNIIDMRNKMGLSREALAKMLGISAKTVSRWENMNSDELPSGTVAIILANLISNSLDIPLEEGKSELISELESMHEKTKIKENPDSIFMLLNEATIEEKSEICKALRLPTDSDVFDISKEYRSTAGHTIGNWFRGDHDMPYKQILVDVANKLKPKNIKTHFALEDGCSEEEIEKNIIEFFAQKIANELNKMTLEKRAEKLEELKEAFRAGKVVDAKTESIDQITKVLTTTTIATSTMVSLLTGPLTAGLFYSGTMAGIWAGVFGMNSSLLLLTGTGVGTLVALPVLLLVLGSPSYSKIIPATLQLINIRRRVTQQLLS